MRIIDWTSDVCSSVLDGDRTARERPRARGAETVVARRCGEDAARALGVGQRTDLVRRAADLEGSGRLKMVGLQPDVGPQLVRKHPAAIERRFDHLRPDAAIGLFDAGELRCEIPRPTLSTPPKSRSDERRGGKECVRTFRT